VTFYSGSSTDAATQSDLLSSSVRVTNNDLTSAHTIYLWTSQTGYTQPAGTPLSTESGSGGSITTGTINNLATGIFQGWADTGAGGTNLFGQAIAITPAIVAATQTGSTFDTGSSLGSFPRAGDYSLTSLTILTISAGGTVNFADHIIVGGAPEPATMVSALLGLGLVGGLARLRRRRVVA
jgi:MYXO-CTERM domain-containing protein